MNNIFSTLIFIMTYSTISFSQLGSQDTGGQLNKEWAAYDIKYYNINLNIDPVKQSIGGRVGVTAEAVTNIKEFVLDLDNRYQISKIVENLPGTHHELKFEHKNGKIKIDLGREILIGNSFSVIIYYSGTPRVAERPPWDDGFTWSKTESGEDWIGVTCQGGGADIWWPCKDHPSDEPDSVSLNFTVPANLICASNGKLKYVDDNKDGTKTYHWFVSTPINNYGISVNIAPYDTIQYHYKSITGENIPVTIWVLPENLELAKEHCPEYLDHLRFYENLIGPYPFRIDKYGVAETPYLGMEHQTIIASGFGYNNEKFGFDWLHHHELGHEWWGNMVTSKDWSDFWIHEAVCGYMQVLYIEEISGSENIFTFMRNWKNWKNEQPIAPRKEMTGGKAYTNDMYSKGSYVLHTLRYYLGDNTFKKVLRRWAYPEPELEQIKTGGQCRFATTDDFLQIAEKVSDKKLDWFWEVYFRQASLPFLNAEIIDGSLHLKWETENNIPFPVPVEIKIDDVTLRISMKDGEGSVKISTETVPVIDPDNWLTMEDVEIKKSE